MNDTLQKYPEVEKQIDEAIEKLQDLKTTYRHLCDTGCAMASIADDLKQHGRKAVDTFYRDQRKEALYKR